MVVIGGKTIMVMEATSGDWIENKIAERHQNVRLRLMREMHARHKTRRARRREIARVLLVGSMVFLGVLMVEMGRKATHLMTTFSTTETTRGNG